MATLFRELTHKYHYLRRTPDSLYFTRIFKIFSNKLIRRGKKKKATRQIHKALIRYRINTRRIRYITFLTRIFRRLQTSIKVVYRRKAKKIHEVPVPGFRNRAHTARFHIMYKAIGKQPHRDLADRIFQELKDLTFYPRRAGAIKAKSAFLTNAFANRTDFEMR